MQIQIQQVWVADWESVFLTNFQVMPELLVHRPLLSSSDLMDGNCFLTHIFSLLSEKTITEGRDTSWACGYELLNWHFLHLSNQGLLHCRQTLYPLSHRGSPTFKKSSRQLHCIYFTNNLFFWSQDCSIVPVQPCF